MAFSDYEMTINVFEKSAAHDAIRLAYGMAKDYRSFWNENLLQLDECALQMLPFAIQIVIASRTDVQS